MIEVRVKGPLTAVRWPGDTCWWLRTGNPNRPPARMNAEHVDGWTDVPMPDFRAAQSVETLNLGPQ